MDKKKAIFIVAAIIGIATISISNAIENTKEGKDNSLTGSGYKVEVVDDEEEYEDIMSERQEDEYTSNISEMYDRNERRYFNVGEITNGLLDITYNGDLKGIVRVTSEKSTINHYIFDNDTKKIGLTDGNGVYTIDTYWYDGARYVIEDSASFELKDGTKEIFSASTINVDYSRSIGLIKAIIDKNKGEDGAETLDNIFEYISEYEYDYDLAEEIIDGEVTVYVKSIGETIQTKKGICSDFARVMAASSRVLGIPAKLVYGNYGGRDQFHAWAEINIGDEWVIYDPTKNIKTTKDSNSYSELEIY